MRYLHHLASSSQWKYLLGGVVGRATGPRGCPSCDSRQFSIADRKFPYVLRRCSQCELLYRFPRAAPAAIEAFYQQDYEQSGLTTDLPGPERLQELLACGFRDTEKDASAILDLIARLNVGFSARILDYGANWGYMTWQLRHAGYDQAQAFELSQPRAAFGRQLGVEIHTYLASCGRDYDVVFSAHVLEHTADPSAVLKAQFDLLKPGGYLVGYTPNGSAAFQAHNPKLFNRIWGMVHPVLLDDRFLEHIFPTEPLLMTTENRLEGLARWLEAKDRKTFDLVGLELLFIVAKGS